MDCVGISPCGRDTKRPTIGRVLSKKRAQKVARRRVSDLRVVERLHEGRHAEHVREHVELAM